MDERIYSLVPIEPPVEVKPPMYKSKHDPRCAIAGSTLCVHGTTQLIGAGVIKKRPARTFGEATVMDPAKFLKCGAKAHIGPGPPRSSNFTYPSQRRATVPRRNERPITGILSKTNFLTANAVDTILAVPRRLAKPEPNYLEKDDYGKVPAYLEQVKDEISRENTMIDAFVREQMGFENFLGKEDYLDEMQETEREELIRLLKAKWDAINKKYQLLAHVVILDTFGRLRRKEQMEKELKAIENDIDKLSRPRVLVRP